MNPINIPCSVHFDVEVAQNSYPLQPELATLIFKQIRATRGFWRQCINSINADPFLFVHGERIFLFYEEQGKIYTNGKIKMLSSPDLKYWTEAQTVLEEPFHLSYPFVFTAEGQIWMIPESCESGAIRLYHATDNTLLHWELEKELLRGKRLVDSSVFRKENLYYLHTCSIENGKNILRLYTSEQIRGPWCEHPASPIAESRNGGSVFSRDGKIFRLSQRDRVYYGNGLDLYEIRTMTPSSYEEVIVRKSFIRKGHHYNMAFFKGKTITARDHAFLSMMVPEFFRRICHYLPLVKRIFN